MSQQGDDSGRPARGNPRGLLSRLERACTVLVPEGDQMRVLALDPVCGQMREVARATRAQPSEATDWVRAQGKRDSEVVRYMHHCWTVVARHDARMAPETAHVFLRIGVRPPPGADLDRRRVGVVYKLLSKPERVTELGNYSGVRADGTEEWQVRVSLPAAEPGVFTFLAWYQDGRGTPLYDDNEGQLHVAPWKPGFEIIRMDPRETSIVVDDLGVRGKVSIAIADLEYHKDIRMVCSMDGWKTHLELGNEGAECNGWRWVRDLWGGFQQWRIELDQPGACEEFEYAMVYRHAAVDAATIYEFWADNGQENFRVRKGQPWRP